MSVNSLTSALRALGTQASGSVQGAQPSKANAFGSIGKDFDFLMKALGSAESAGKGTALDTLTQGLSAMGTMQPAQAAAANPFRAGGQASAVSAFAAQASPAQAIRFVNAMAAPLASIGKTISVTA
jgi:catalase (peroxidase I)